MAEPITIDTSLDFLDFPTAWAIQNAGLIEHTSQKCSAVAANGALLCDCGGIFKAWEKLREDG